MHQRVLIIDDSQPIHALVRVRLAGEDVELHSAHNGFTGLKAAQDNPPDVILLDVDMPDMNGFEVCRQLKADERTMDVPVIFLTGASSTEEKIKGLELGAVDYITKPFDPAELRARVRSSLRTKYLLDLLSRKAMIDGLTGLWNRRYFDRRLTEEISMARRTKRPLACILGDLDHFKSCNDKFGHTFGDEVLRCVSATMGGVVRTEDILCRYGGEEFAVIVPNSSMTGAAELGERLRVAISTTSIGTRADAMHVTASFGVAHWSADQDEKTLLDRADAALYRAKQDGRNRVVRADDAITASAA
ncbi:MAG: diguanylate cyclase [Anaerolineae bacterium]|nr:diguanylate cyclase [Phycisphaerae bacterium]